LVPTFSCTISLGLGNMALYMHGDDPCIDPMVLALTLVDFLTSLTSLTPVQLTSLVSTNLSSCSVKSTPEVAATTHHEEFNSTEYSRHVHKDAQGHNEIGTVSFCSYSPVRFVKIITSLSLSVSCSLSIHHYVTDSIVAAFPPIPMKSRHALFGGWKRCGVSHF